MKLKVFDRILLALLLILAIVVAFVLFGVAANLIPEDMANGFVSLFYLNAQNRLILAGAGLVVLLIALKLVFAGRGEKKEERPVSAMIRQSDIGGTFVSLSAIDSMVQKHCRAQSRIRDCISTIHPGDNGITIGIRLSVLPDTDIKTLTDELQRSLKEYIEGLTGITVNEIGVLVESASTPVTNTTIARVE